DAYHESVLLGNELTKKASETRDGAAGESDGDFSEDDGASRKARHLSERVGAELGEALGNTDEPSVDGKYKALFAMDFMQKAREQQQARARDEAKNILRVLESMEDEANLSAGSDNDEGLAGDKAALAANEDREKEKAAKLAAAREEMGALLGGSGLGGAKSMALRDRKGAPALENAESAHNPWLTGSGGSERSADSLTGSSVSRKKGGVVKDTVTENSRIVGDSPAALARVWTEELSSSAQGETTKKNKKRKKGAKTSDDMNNGKSNSRKTAPEVANETQKERKPLLMQKSQNDLVKQAFAGPDLEAEFHELKEKAVDDELNISDKKRKIMTEDKAGWGDWAGPGLLGVSASVVEKRRRLLKNLDEKKAEMRAGRKDGVLANVLLSEKRVKTASKYKIADIPHPFKTRDEYERSLQMPLGEEWNAAQVVRKNTKPVIMTRAGRIIAPIKLPKKSFPGNRKGL
ncbi:UTP14, partial [Symbiodinium microadriaticum]